MYTVERIVQFKGKQMMQRKGRLGSIKSALGFTVYTSGEQVSLDFLNYGCGHRFEEKQHFHHTVGSATIYKMSQCTSAQSRQHKERLSMYQA